MTANTNGRGRTIHELYEERATIWASRRGLPDKLFDAAVHLADEIGEQILAKPCQDGHDLRLKLTLWGDLIKDPACILDKHVELWARLRADFECVIDQATPQSPSSFARAA